MAILQSPKENKILFAEDGIDRWEAAPLARRLVERVRQNGEQIAISKADVAVINRMAQLLRIGKRYNSPFKSIAIDMAQITVSTRDILQVFD